VTSLEHLAALVEALSHAALEMDAEGWRVLDAARAELRRAGLPDPYSPSSGSDPDSTPR
jgi:hypothetical protein